MTRPLTTCEETGTKLISKYTKNRAEITGSYLGGFILEVHYPDGNMQDGMKLPFESISCWLVSYD